MEPTASLENRKCPIHKKVLEYYCLEDATCVCVSCCLIGEHRGHQMESLHETAEKNKEKMQNILGRLISERKKNKNKSQSLQEESGKLEDTIAGLTGETTVLFIGVREQLETLEKQVLSQIRRSGDKVKEIYSCLKTHLEIKMEELSRKVGHIEELSRKVGHIEELSRKVGHIEELSRKVDHIEELSRKAGYIEELSRKAGHIEKLSRKAGHIEELSREAGHIEELSRKVGHIEELSRKVGHIEELCATMDPLAILKGWDSGGDDEEKSDVDCNNFSKINKSVKEASEGDDEGDNDHNDEDNEEDDDVEDYDDDDEGDEVDDESSVAGEYGLIFATIHTGLDEVVIWAKRQCKAEEASHKSLDVDMISNTLLDVKTAGNIIAIPGDGKAMTFSNICSAVLNLAVALPIFGHKMETVAIRDTGHWDYISRHALQGDRKRVETGHLHPPPRGERARARQGTRESRRTEEIARGPRPEPE
uniref:B box-type domain-containing protein n=1 Tax=Leptobrachium leishanense TaxID=445787 RepID=A0A8C5PZB2_9ANUR